MMQDLAHTVLQALIWLLSFVILMLIFRYLRSLRKPEMKVELTAAPESRDDLFDSAPIGYLELDRQGILRRVNASACRLLGRQAREVVGKHCTELVAEVERNRYREQLARKIAADTALMPYQREFVRPDGHKVTLEIHEQLLRTSKGV